MIHRRHIRVSRKTHYFKLDFLNGVDLGANKINQICSILHKICIIINQGQCSLETLCIFCCQAFSNCVIKSRVKAKVSVGFLCKIWETFTLFSSHLFLWLKNKSFGKILMKTYHCVRIFRLREVLHFCFQAFWTRSQIVAN